MKPRFAHQPDITQQGYGGGGAAHGNVKGIPPMLMTLGAGSVDSGGGVAGPGGGPSAGCVDADADVEALGTELLGDGLGDEVAVLVADGAGEAIVVAVVVGVVDATTGS